MIKLIKKYRVKYKLKRQLKALLKRKQMALFDMLDNKVSYQGNFFTEVYYPMIGQINNLKDRIDKL